MLGNVLNALSVYGAPKATAADIGGYSPVTEPNAYYDTLNKQMGLPSMADQSAAGAAASTANAGEKSLLDSIFGSMLGKTDANGNKTDGWGGLALGGAQAGFNLWNGMKQFGLAEDHLKESKRQYDQNFAAQRKTLNTQMEDRQAARVASNPTAYESVGSYMQKNGI